MIKVGVKMSYQRLVSEYNKLWKRRGSISYHTLVTEDDLQEAFYHIYKNKMENFEAKSNGESYIYMVAKSKAYKRYKKLDALKDCADITVIEQIYQTDPNFIDFEVSDYVEQVKDKTLRECLILNLQGYSGRELSKIYNIPSTSLNRNLSKVKHGINSILE